MKKQSSAASTSSNGAGSSRFPLTTLTLAQEKQFRVQASALLTKSIQDCERTLADIDGQWKFVRLHQGLKVYKAKSPNAPSELMVTGIVRGSLHDVMSCMYADNSFQFRVNSALLMPKEHLDCEVLHAINTKDNTHPFRFNGIKWCATKWPGGTMNKTRDMCFFETTGITQARDNQGQLLEYGYSIMESIELAQCPHLDMYSIVRAKMSVRHLFRELPLGCTMVVTHCTVDPSGILPTWMTDFSTLPHLLSISRAVEVSESIRLSKALLDQVNSSPNASSASWTNRLSLFNRGSECALCENGSQFKLEKKRIVEAVGAGVKTAAKYFCPVCLAASLRQGVNDSSPVGPDLTNFLLQQQQAPSSYSMVSKPSSATIYSDDLSEDMSELSSIYEELAPLPPPILDFDDDEAEESVYSGLDFDYRSTCLSENSTSFSTESSGAVLYEHASPSHSHYSMLSNSVRLYDSSPRSSNNSSNGSSPTMSPSILAQQLVHLNMQMDNTVDIMRRNRLRMTSLHSKARP
ncbi:hypothetical protein DYB32_006872 [Aphanomyces invadans]|uniref:START domain-containing protein n=1 Tax=Aphanomyces invadans TaxID=157072 RepID=A0A3R6VIT8_9STRA|nr:hypothetical protein DYB32_006872 [Aphanomyces invadans]